MNKDEIVINTERIHQNSEATTTVSNISYEIENARARGLSDIRLKEQLNTLETEGHFPSNLDYKVSYTDEETGLSASVFVDKHTGKLLLEWLEKI